MFATINGIRCEGTPAELAAYILMPTTSTVSAVSELPAAIVESVSAPIPTAVPTTIHAPNCHIAKQVKFGYSKVAVGTIVTYVRKNGEQGAYRRTTDGWEWAL
jgi:hypothetical protein